MVFSLQWINDTRSVMCNIYILHSSVASCRLNVSPVMHPVCGSRELSWPCKLFMFGNVDDDRELVEFIIDSILCRTLNYWRASRCRPRTLVHRICRQLLAISCRRVSLPQQEEARWFSRSIFPGPHSDHQPLMLCHMESVTVAALLFPCSCCCCRWL